MEEIYDLVLYSKDMCNCMKKYYNYSLEELSILKSTNQGRLDRVLRRKAGIRRDYIRLNRDYKEALASLDISLASRRNGLFDQLEAYELLRASLRQEILSLERACKDLMDQKYLSSQSIQNYPKRNIYRKQLLSSLKNI